MVPSWMLVRRPMRMRCTSPRIDGVHPDAALLADLDVADDLGAVVDEGRLMHHRKAPLIAPKHL